MRVLSWRGVSAERDRVRILVILWMIHGKPVLDYWPNIPTPICLPLAQYAETSRAIVSARCD